MIYGNHHLGLDRDKISFFLDEPQESAVYAPRVLFDVFGTLIRIQHGSHPYRSIFKIGMEQGRRPRADDAKNLLSMALDLREASDFFGITVPAQRMTEIQAALDVELARMESYPDAVEAVSMLQNAGCQVGVCSNLAKPYAAAIERLYPSVVLRAYSFEVGSVKPAAQMYAHSVGMMGTTIPNQVTMIGDSYRCDKEGPCAFGMRGYFLNREGIGDYASLTDFAADLLQRYS